MKLSKLTLACLLATSTLPVTNSANAAATEGFEFHGYFRAGTLMSVENDFKRSNYAGTKEAMGRLGLEADNDASVELRKTWAFDDDKAIKIVVSAAGTGFDNALGSSADATHMGIGQTYVEFAGVSPSGKLWGGTRDYGKDNYIFMTDFFYTDMSGTGIGLTDYEIGDFLIDLAYIASDRNDFESDARFDGTNTNNLLHAFNMSARFGALELSGLYKTMPDNWDAAGHEYAETGFDLTAIYNLDTFFFIPGNGFSKIIAQGGVGLGAGNLLGGTITTYNSYHPGSLWQGGPDGTTKITYVEQEDKSARLLLWGGYFLSNGINLFPSLQAQYNQHDNDTYDYWASAMIRPTFPVSENFFVQTELGAVYNNWDGSSWNQQKVTVAPTWIIGTGTGPAPEIRLLASYVNNSWTVDDGGADVIVGLQADMWW